MPRMVVIVVVIVHDRGHGYRVGDDDNGDDCHGG